MDNTRIVREFRPEEIRRLKAESTKDISVAGPTLAAQFIKAGLVDEYALYYVPVVLGAGNPVFKDFEGRLDLDLIEERRFPTGMIFLRYANRDMGSRPRSRPRIKVRLGAKAVVQAGRGSSGEPSLHERRASGRFCIYPNPSPPRTAEFKTTLSICRRTGGTLRRWLAECHLALTCSMETVTV